VATSFCEDSILCQHSRDDCGEFQCFNVVCKKKIASTPHFYLVYNPHFSNVVKFDCGALSTCGGCGNIPDESCRL
jgi:hypothetical protein